VENSHDAVIQALRAVVEKGYWVREGRGDPTEDWAVPLPVYMDAVLALSELDPARDGAANPSVPEG
jgi:hypothetical protein